MHEHIPILRSMYVSDWNEYRKRRWQFLFVFLLLWPASALLALATVQLAKNDTLVLLIVPPCGLAYLVTVLRLVAFACPRCGKPFFHRTFGGDPFTRKCFHCDLAKWSTCTESERVLWLSRSPANEWQCLSCHATMPSSAETCTACGWTYADSSNRSNRDPKRS